MVGTAASWSLTAKHLNRCNKFSPNVKVYLWLLVFSCNYVTCSFVSPHWRQWVGSFCPHKSFRKSHKWPWSSLWEPLEWTSCTHSVAVISQSARRRNGYWFNTNEDWVFNILIDCAAMCVCVIMPPSLIVYCSTWGVLMCRGPTVGWRSWQPWGESG